MEMGILKNFFPSVDTFINLTKILLTIILFK